MTNGFDARLAPEDRHATGTVQCTAANAMAALMLAVSVLREIDDQGNPVQLHA